MLGGASSLRARAARGERRAARAAGVLPRPSDTQLVEFLAPGPNARRSLDAPYSRPPRRPHPDMASAPSSSIGARVAERARAAPPLALAGGDGASTLLSHLAAEHSHGRGLLGFFDNAGARKSLSRVCREFRREVARFRWPVVELRGHTDAVWDVCALGGERVASVSDDMTLRVWSTAMGACDRIVSLAGHRDSARGMCALSNDRVVIGSYDKTLRVWNIATGACERVLVGTKTILDVCVLADGRVLSTMGYDVAVWNLLTGVRDVLSEGHTCMVSCVCALAGGCIVSGSFDQTLCVWSLTAGVCERVLNGHTSDVYDVCALADGRVVSGSADNTLRLWNLVKGVCECVLEGHTDTVFAVCALADGRVVSSSLDSTCRVWNITMGVCERVLKSHASTVNRVTELTDGCFVTASKDSTLRVWRV